MCVTNEMGKVKSIDSFRVAVGKIYNKYDDAQDMLYSQTSEVIL